MYNEREILTLYRDIQAEDAYVRISDEERDMEEQRNQSVDYNQIPLTELKRVVLGRYPAAKMRYREHETKARYRLFSGETRHDNPGRWLNVEWTCGERRAWIEAYKYVLKIIEWEAKSNPPVLDPPLDMDSDDMMR